MTAQFHHICKSDIFGWDLIDSDIQIELLKNHFDYDNGKEDAEENLYVEFKYKSGSSEIIPLSRFMRINGNGRFHGSYCISNNSGFLIAISRDGNMALITQI